MPIPKKKVKIQLEKTEPSKITVKGLQKQLKNIGLTCAHTDPKRLEKYKEEVEKQFLDGINQSYGIEKPKQSSDGSPYYDSIYGNVDAPYLGLEKVAESDWEPQGTGHGYGIELSTVIFPKHFDFLMENKSEFGGTYSDERITEEKYDTVESIKQLFIQVGLECSASLV